MTGGPEDDGRDPSLSVLDEFLGQRPDAAWRRGAQWIAIAIIAGVLALLFARFVSGGSPADYLSEPVVRDDLPVRIAGTGRLLPTATRAVGAGLDGTVIEVLARPGQRVATGQILARLDPLPLQDALADSAALAEARQETLAKAEGRAAQAQSTLHRFEAVRRRSGGLVPSDREMAEARAELDRADEAARSARLEIAPATAELAARRDRLAASDIVAPVGGTILQSRAAPGLRLGGAGDARPLFVIAQDLSRLRLEMVAAEGLATAVRPGQTVRLAFGNRPGRAFAATVRRATAAPAAPAVRTADRPAERAAAVPVALSLDVANPGLALRPAPEVAVRVDLGLRRDRMLVPDAALRFAEASGLERDARSPARPGHGSVLVLKEDGTPRRVAVSLGGGDGKRTEVVSGALEPGMRVIVGLR